MDESKKQTVAADSLKKVHNYLKEEDWARAFAHFLVIFELYPDRKRNFEVEFENVLSHLRLRLESQNRIENIFNCYVQAIRHFPTNVRMLNDFASYWLRINQPEFALQYLEAAHEIDEEFLLAEKNLQSAKLSILPRWHFRMLNDSKRNRAYYEAISKAITPYYNKVLDIGAGCGLLSFYASQCKDVQKIISIESSNTLSAIAKRCLQNTNFVTVINSNSTVLDRDNIGISNVLITEIFDTALFGEHMLETLIHAWDNLLEPSSKIIPYGADIYITGINSDIILGKHKVINNNFTCLKNMCITQYATEPYEAENLNEKNVKYITSVEKVLSIDFNNVQRLKEIYLIDNSISPVTLRCLESGTIDAIAVWFDLHLDDVISITTNPKSNYVDCWEQAVIYLDHPLVVTKDQDVKLQVSCTDDVLKVKIFDISADCPNCFKISSDMITYLNDVHITKVAEMFTLPDRFNYKQCVILDLCPVPLFALNRARSNFPGHYICVGTNENDCSFLNVLWDKNVSCTTTDITYEVIVQEDISDLLLENSIDIIFVNPISENGILSEEIFSKLSILNAALKKDGLLLPQNVYLQMEVIDSKYLDFCSKVNEENLLGFKAADEMNKYSILEQWQVQSESYPRKTLCTLNTDFNILNNNPLTINLNAVMLKDGIANGILYGYKLEYSDNIFIETFQSSHYNNACFIFKNPHVVNNGDTFLINVIKIDGLLKIICKNKD
ncbi:hypothetical protein ILUMI_00477 [Ignelater luminosus]|uniref:Protein arginine N-methyltransferase domain-containing protein n=1 Tax=Ignelater luminosus TaxID=2038154 RepID=A0A8K0DGD2_IGNLU|nr:hypothetical protein ILUMI_00477 [Ignelater luminosus]